MKFCKSSHNVNQNQKPHPQIERTTAIQIPWNRLHSCQMCKAPLLLTFWIMFASSITPNSIQFCKNPIWFAILMFSLQELVSTVKRRFVWSNKGLISHSATDSVNGTGELPKPFESEFSSRRQYLSLLVQYYANDQKYLWKRQILFSSPTALVPVTNNLKMWCVWYPICLGQILIL